jgi:4-amino-4-deoxychorismate lyase
VSPVAPGSFSLIETMRWQPGIGIARSKLHRNRFANSARKLGFAGHDAAWKALVEQASTLAACARLRLELSSDGRFEIAVSPFVPQADDTVWSVRIANAARLQSAAPLLRHKTSLRSVYDAARGEFGRTEADEVLLLNDRQEICEGTISNIFVEVGDGLLLTPPLSSGCLAGVLRSALLCARKARATPITPAMLAEKPFYVGNSLRGLIRAKLHP